MSILEHPNWLFISFEQAAGGHRLARALCALPELYWYSHTDNGIHPWNVVGETSIQQRWVSKFHYNRYTPDGHLPPPHDFVQDYLPDAESYYRDIFLPKFIECNGERLLDNHILPYCTHAIPRDIYRYFPNAKIINIIHDVDRCVNRYRTVGLNFPGLVKHTGTVPADNTYLMWLMEIQKGTPDILKVKDVWAQKNYSQYWNDSMLEHFMTDKRQFFEMRYHSRSTTYHKNVLNTTNVKDYKLMKEFIRGHKQIDIPDWSTRIKMECGQLGFE